MVKPVGIICRLHSLQVCWQGEAQLFKLYIYTNLFVLFILLYDEYIDSISYDNSRFFHRIYYSKVVLSEIYADMVFSLHPCSIIESKIVLDSYKHWIKKSDCPS